MQKKSSESKRLKGRGEIKMGEKMRNPPPHMSMSKTHICGTILMESYLEIVEALVYNLGYKKDTPAIRKNGRKASGQDLCAWLGTQGKGKPLRWTLTLSRKWLSPRPLIRVPGPQAEGTGQACWLRKNRGGRAGGWGGWTALLGMRWAGCP